VRPRESAANIACGTILSLIWIKAGFRFVVFKRWHEGSEHSRRNHWLDHCNRYFCDIGLCRLLLSQLNDDLLPSKRPLTTSPREAHRRWWENFDLVVVSRQFSQPRHWIKLRAVKKECGKPVATACETQVKHRIVIVCLGACLLCVRSRVGFFSSALGHCAQGAGPLLSQSQVLHPNLAPGRS
jgi:hypothetical protein